jgi:pimeloyl-ACP methyl ester carboxylesterase
VAVLHGGPGAPGSAAPVARTLAARGVASLEPLQAAVSIEGQLDELHDLLLARSEPPIVLVGWSWGAWLSLLFAVGHPSVVRKAVLVGSGPFEQRYAAGIRATRLSRLTEDERVEYGRGELSSLARLSAMADAYDALPHADETLELQPAVHRLVSAEAAELRRSGVHLERVTGVSCPVVAIHGDHDPHPAEGVRAPLARVLDEFSFVLLARCGHEPWNERYARDRFFKILARECR